MLNKDQYNQEEYNDYYRQESEGAEIGGSDEEGGMMGKIVILLIILGLATAGYYGYKTLSSASSEEIDTSLKVSAESSLPQSVQAVKEEISKEELVVQKEVETPQEIIPKTEEVPTNTISKEETPESQQLAVITEVTKQITKQQQEDISPEAMTAVIEAVLKQMNEQKSLEGASPASEAVKKDAVLIDKLSQSDVDSVSTNLVKELENVSLSENTKVDNDKKQVDVYNKVNLQDISGEDTLSQLSDEINAVTEEKVNTDTADTYTSSLKKEINVRQDEMRIIVVRKGDTLGKIAKRAYGNVMDYEKIYRANPEVTRPDRIYIGQKLRIPNE